jgi:hypothetical protein
LDSVEKTTEEVRDYQKFGGQALVDMAPIGYGRDPDGLATGARLTGLHIIACTGLVSWKNQLYSRKITGLRVSRATIVYSPVMFHPDVSIPGVQPARPFSESNPRRDRRCPPPGLGQFIFI